MNVDFGVVELVGLGIRDGEFELNVKYLYVVKLVLNFNEINVSVKVDMSSY